MRTGGPKQPLKVVPVEQEELELLARGAKTALRVLKRVYGCRDRPNPDCKGPPAHGG